MFSPLSRTGMRPRNTHRCARVQQLCRPSLPVPRCKPKLLSNLFSSVSVSAELAPLNVFLRSPCPHQDLVSTYKGSKQSNKCTVIRSSPHLSNSVRSHFAPHTSTLPRATNHLSFLYSQITMYTTLAFFFLCLLSLSSHSNYCSPCRLRTPSRSRSIIASSQKRVFEERVASKPVAGRSQAVSPHTPPHAGISQQLSFSFWFVLFSFPIPRSPKPRTCVFLVFVHRPARGRSGHEPSRFCIAHTFHRRCFHTHNC